MWAFSKASLVLIKIPALLAFPDAITIASGVANPKLHGHATTRTSTNIFIENAKSFEIINHIIKLIIAIIIIVGTKYPLILSAIF